MKFEFLLVTFLATGLLYLCSQAVNTDADNSCDLKTYSLSQGHTLLNNVDDTVARVFIADSAEFSMLYGKTDSLVLMTLDGYNLNCFNSSEAKTLDASVRRKFLRNFNRLSDLAAYHVLVTKPEINIITTEQPDVLFLKRRGKLVYVYFGLLSCNESEFVTQTIMRLQNVK